MPKSTLSDFNITRIEWTLLGTGAANVAYVSQDKQYVLKIPRTDVITTLTTDYPERAVRVWNELNPQLGNARVINSKFGVGWICPYIDGTQASDEDIHLALIKLFNSSGRIVADAIVARNFLKQVSGNNEVICVDIGMALHLARDDSHYYSRTKRRNSLCSITAWENMEEVYATAFFNKPREHQKSITTIKALLYITITRADIIDVDFLQRNWNLINILAKAYDAHYQNTASEFSFLNNNACIEEANKALAALLPINFGQVQQVCVIELQKYISARGTVAAYPKLFTPSLVTRLTRDHNLTTTKVTRATELIAQINKAMSFDQLEEIIQTAIATPQLMQARFRSGLANALRKCERIINMAKYQPEFGDNEDGETIPLVPI